MESEITIELEQSFASVVRYIQNKADNNAALYFDDLPEAFAVPSLYFPVPRTDTKKVTFSTYLTTLYLDTWFMEATDWQAYADAATVRDSLMMDECKVNIMVDAFVQPKLDDPELMEFYKVNDRLDMPETLFADRDDFRYANKCVMEACGLAAKRDEEETVKNLKN